MTDPAPDPDSAAEIDSVARSFPVEDFSDGTLVRSRVEPDAAAPLATALDRELTGYAVLESQDALLLDGDGVGVVAFEDGVPRLAYHTGTGRGGSNALADLAAPGPYDVELRELSADELPNGDADLRVPPGMPADRLAGDPDLAERTRQVAPTEWTDGGSQNGAEAGSLDAVEAFLDDEEKIDAIRDRAREEAKERAEQWGLDGEME